MFFIHAIANDQLAVVVSSLTQHNPDLAISNVLGACTANILGSFSLGLIFAPSSLTISGQDQFSSRIYSGLLVAICIFVIVVGPGWKLFAGFCWTGEIGSAGRWAGILLLVTFTVYVVGIVYGIQKGSVVAPEGSDSDSSSDETSESEDEDEPSEETGDRPIFPILIPTASGGECFDIDETDVRRAGPSSTSVCADTGQTSDPHTSSYRQSRSIRRSLDPFGYSPFVDNVVTRRPLAHITIYSGSHDSIDCDDSS